MTIDLRLQQAAENALRYGIRIARANKAWAANGGAIVAMDPRNGEILALASNPTFKPNVFVGRTDPEKLAPLLNARVAEPGELPGPQPRPRRPVSAGLTLRLVTALAAMQEGLVGRWDYLPCRLVRLARPALRQLESVRELRA